MDQLVQLLGKNMKCAKILKKKINASMVTDVYLHMEITNLQKEGLMNQKLPI
jgi:hypothetical protein